MTSNVGIEKEWRVRIARELEDVRDAFPWRQRHVVDACIGVVLAEPKEATDSDIAEGDDDDAYRFPFG